MTTPVVEDTLTALDRCDRCGAQAYVRARLVGGELLFCSHHWTEVAPKLEHLKVMDTRETMRA